MKKIFIFLAMMFMLPVFADTQPYYVKNVCKGLTQGPFRETHSENHLKTFYSIGEADIV